ncbi:hypothetical protein AYI70_g7458 [Smittium culicis]|uniref:Uncharacterized protein n=1 Tax=Smittium culicis TaxID=133412 RepID=A0A1R1XKL4_9FUNG|nr:hypothetical protein AYI70_g7458 [Smittium culicis]
MYTDYANFSSDFSGYSSDFPQATFSSDNDSDYVCQSDCSVNLTLHVSPPTLQKIKLHVNKRPSEAILSLMKLKFLKRNQKRMSVAHISAIYPVSLLDLDLVRNHFFINPVIYHDLMNYVIGIAKNDDGIKQIHCYLHYCPKKNLKAHNSFKIDGYCPEITTVHSMDSVIRKCFSLDKFHLNFDSLRLKKFRLSPAQRIFISASQSEAMDIVYTDKKLSNHLLNSPRKLINHQFKEIPEINQWDRNEHCLWLYRDTRNEKTAYALTLFEKPLVVSSYRMLLDLRDEHDGIVFDDMSFTNLSHEESIYITDLKLPRPIKIKELKTEVIIPAGMPRVFTSNKKIFNFHPAIQRRLVFINCNYDLRLYPDGVPPPPHPLMPKISDFN